MSYCINPDCKNPKNASNVRQCQSCGWDLLLRDRYSTAKPLGKGGFGATFLAKDCGLPGQPECVIKQLRPASTAPQAIQMAQELFEREAKILGRIGVHPQVPRLLDYFRYNDQFYLVQEYVEGETLKQEVKKTGIYHEEQVKQLLLELLPVLQYLHDNGVIHRDIKPANIMRRRIDERLVLIDFGAVKEGVGQTALMQANEEAANTKFAIGTLGYTPIEQIAMYPVFASDLYALGATCLYLLTEKSPKDFGSDPRTGAMRWQNQVSVTPHLARILERMLESAVRDRYQSAKEVLQDLQRPPAPDESTSADAQTIYLIEQPLPLTRQKQAQRSEAPTVEPASENISFSPSTMQQASMIRERRERTKSTVRRSASLSSPSSNSSGGQKLDGKSVRTAYFKGKRDFVSLDLSGVSLAKTKLAGARFYEANLSRADLQEGDLSSANLTKANLSRAVLRDANLREAHLSYANLSGADLRGADLTDARLTHANLQGANLCGANLLGSNLTAEQLAVARTNWRTVMPDGKRG